MRPRDMIQRKDYRPIFDQLAYTITVQQWRRHTSLYRVRKDHKKLKIRNILIEGNVETWKCLEVGNPISSPVRKIARQEVIVVHTITHSNPMFHSVVPIVCLALVI